MTNQTYFFDMVDVLDGLRRGDEEFLCRYQGERSDFVRFNQSRLRQAGRVEQRQLHLSLIRGHRHASATWSLSGEPEQDRRRLQATVAQLREAYAQLPDDPFLCFAETVQDSDTRLADELPPAEAMVETLLDSGTNQDLVGIHASGPIYAGFANSFGQRNWFEQASYNLDWSLYLREDKAFKLRQAGFQWDAAAVLQRQQAAVERLPLLARPPRNLAPGHYRVFLAPEALEEITDLLGWGGFSLRAQRSGTTPLLRLSQGEVQLQPMVHIQENTAAGSVPPFQEAGFIRPEQVSLITGGELVDYLVDPRSAVEYGVTTNGASSGEIPQSLDMAAGDLASKDVLSALDTGLYVANLWYLNYADRNAARLTGMTRFATFWVENGIIQAPVNPLRFDDSLYRILGERLVALTEEREFLLDPGSYGSRSQRSSRLPGALVEAMRFVL